MGLSDRIQALRERVQRKASERRVKKKAKANRKEREAEKRRRRIRRGKPANRREGAVVAAREARSLGGDARELAQTAPGAKAAGRGGSRVLDAVRAAKAKADAARLAEARDRAVDRARDGKGGVSERAERLAMSRPPVEGDLDPRADGRTVEELVRGGGADPAGEGFADGIEELVLGMGDPGADTDDVDEGNPLEFDDPLGVMGGSGSGSEGSGDGGDGYSLWRDGP